MRLQHADGRAQLMRNVGDEARLRVERTVHTADGAVHIGNQRLDLARQAILVEQLHRVVRTNRLSLRDDTVERPDCALHERRPGGRIALYVTSKSCMQSWRFASDATHRTYDEADLTALMLETGFEKVAIKPLDLPLDIVGLIAVGTKPRPDGSAFMTTASRPETGAGPIPSL